MISKKIMSDCGDLIPDEWKSAYASLTMIAAYYYMMFGEDAPEKMKTHIENCKDSEEKFLASYKVTEGIDENEAFKAHFINNLNFYLEACCPDPNRFKVLVETTTKINTKALAFIKEIIQNADDCKYADGVTPAFELQLFENNTVIVHYNELGMTWQHILALTTVGDSTKNDDSKTGGEESLTTGEKGIGFKTIFAYCDRVDVLSNGYSFTITGGGYRTEPLTPDNEDLAANGGTTLRLYLRDNNNVTNDETKDKYIFLTSEQIYNSLQGMYGADNKQDLFRNCPVMFTRHLCSITVSYGEKKFTVLRKDDKYHPAVQPGYSGTREFTVSLDDKDVHCFGIYKDIEIPEKVFQSRYDNLKYPADKTPQRRIQIIAALDETVSVGNLYSYLPADKEIQAPFNIQLPVKLNINRTRMFFFGDSDTSQTNSGAAPDAEKPDTILWNEFMVEELKSMLPEFYKALRETTDKLWRYIPKFDKVQQAYRLRLFIGNNDDDYMNSYFIKVGFGETFIGIPYFRVKGTDDYYSGEKVVMVDEALSCISDNGEQIWYNLLGLREKLDKNLTEYDEKALEAGKPVGLTLFEDYKPYDLPALFNQMLCECSVTGEKRNELRERLKNLNQNQKSKLLKALSQNPLALALEIYPARVIGKKEPCYISGDGIWLHSTKLSAPVECFFNFMEKPECEFITFASQSEITELSDVLGAIQSEKQSLTVAELDMLIEFLRNNGYTCDKADPYEFGKVVLEDSNLGEAFAKLVGKVKEGNENDNSTAVHT